MLPRRVVAVLLAALVAVAGPVPSAGSSPADPPLVEGTWSPSPPAPIHLYEPSLVPLPDGRIFVVGQRVTPSTPPFQDLLDAGNAAYYDPETDTFERVADPSRALVGDAVLLPDGRIAAFGGRGNLGCGQGEVPDSIGEVYDPDADEWTAIPAGPLNACVGGPSAVVLPDGRVLVSGPGTALWDPEAGTIDPLAGGPYLMWDMLVHDGMVYGLGFYLGIESGAGAIPTRLDLSTLSWTKASHAGVNPADSKRQSLFVLDDSTLFMGTLHDAALIDMETLDQTPLAQTGPFCSAGVLGTGTPFLLPCNHGKLYVLDRAEQRMVDSGLPLPSELHNSFFRTITVPSGTYFVGLNTAVDGFAFARFTPAPPASNTDPTASDIHRVLRGGTTAQVFLGGSDADGDPLTLTVEGEPDHGELTGTPPTLTYTPDAGYLGADEFTFRVDDGAGGSDVGTVTLTVTDPVDGESGVTQNVAAGQTVRTGDEPTTSEPTQVGVTSPVPGTVEIARTDAGAGSTGYYLFGEGFAIEAPSATATEPLRLAFTFDEALLPPGETTADVVMFRDGVPIQPCADGSGQAIPDPCVADRSSSGGVGQIVVLSSHASVWTLGVAQRATSTSLSPVPQSTYGMPISLIASVDRVGGATPTGTVTFRDLSTSPATELGSAPVTSDGTATLDGLVLDAGEHRVTASYGGSATSLPSESEPRTVTVSKAPVTVVAQPVSLLAGLLTGKFTFSAAVVDASTGLPVVGATVEFRSVLANGRVFGCSATTDSLGVATCRERGVAGLWAAIYPSVYQARAFVTQNHAGGVATGRYSL